MDSKPADDGRVNAGLERGKKVSIFLADRAIVAYEGESVAAALVAAGVRVFRTTARGEPRGPYCGMGVCFDCTMTVNGQPNVRTCAVPVQDGMRLEVQKGSGTWRVEP